MIIAPSVTMKGGMGSCALPSNRPRIKAVRPIPQTFGDVDLKLSEGHRAYYIQTHPHNHIELIETFSLEEFKVVRGNASWTFVSGAGQIIEGSSQSCSLLPRLSVKLVTPVVLLPSKSGLRMTFRFRKDPGFEVVGLNKFKDLIGREV